MTNYILITVSLIIVGLSYSTFTLLSANSRLEEQLEVNINYQRQLQEQTVTNTNQRLEFESRLAELEEELLEASYQLTSLKDTLAQAERRENPEYEALLERARREVAATARQRAGRANNRAFSMFSDPATSRKLAEDRITGNFVDYLEGLDLSSSEIDNVYQAMVSFNEGRYQMLDELMDGNLTADQVASVFGPNAMVESLLDLLSPEQAAELSDYQIGVNQKAARAVYSQFLTSSGSAIYGEPLDMAMDVLLDELFSEQNNYGALAAANGSMTTAYNDKLETFVRVRDRLETDLNSDQLAQFDSFVQSQEGSTDLILEASDDGSGNLQLRNIKVSAENLPN